MARAGNPWRRSIPLARVLNLVRRLQFRCNLLRNLRMLSPDIVIAYEPPAIASVGRLLPSLHSQRTVRVWHFHEYPELMPGVRLATHSDLDWARRHLDLADLVIFPDYERAKYLRHDIPSARPPVVVMNCPRRLQKVPAATLLDRLKAREGVTPGPTVLFHGVVGDSYALSPLVRSMAYWPPGALFVLAGISKTAFKRSLQAEAESLGFGARVVFLGVPEPAENWSLRSGADVAATLMVPHCLTTRFCAGASNKRFEAMAVGIAQVSDRNPGVPELVERNGVGLCAPHDNPEAVGREVARLLNDAPLRREMGERARRLHLDRYNYETEFAPVLKRLLEMVAEGRAMKSSARAA
jgi:colanic acid biosynthesis glycosyl transferase WcaI